MTARSTLYRNGRVHTPCHPAATALHVADDTVTWVGPDAEAPPADTVVDLRQGLVTPAFVDAHVHLTQTGLALTGVDLSHVRSAAELLDALARYAAGLPTDAVVLAHGWDDAAWPDPTPPDTPALLRAAGGRPVYATQASMHSALCAGAPLARAEGHAGYDPSGWLRRDAHHAARRTAFAEVTAAQRAAAAHAALRHAAALGIAAVHECGGPDIAGADDLAALVAGSGADRTPEVYGLWGRWRGAAEAMQLGAVGAAGDLFADGALGARTAWLRAPYADHPAGPDDSAACGHGYLTADEVAAHLRDCHAHGVPGGFHAIGDAALAEVRAGFALAAEELGVDRLRAARHRLEHVEMPDRAVVAGLVEYGVVASVQPAFDRLWGGDRGMYARRLGPERAAATNPLAAMHTVGVPLAFGSDSPVTPLAPWQAVQAAAWHHEPAQRLSVKAAFAAHTRGGWRAVHRDDHGALAPGAPATFAVWDTPAGRDGTLPVLLAPDPEQRGPDDPTPLPRCRRTVRRGETIFDAEEDPLP